MRFSARTPLYSFKSITFDPSDIIVIQGSGRPGERRPHATEFRIFFVSD